MVVVVRTPYNMEHPRCAVGGGTTTCEVCKHNKPTRHDDNQNQPLLLPPSRLHPFDEALPCQPRNGATRPATVPSTVRERVVPNRPGPYILRQDNTTLAKLTPALPPVRRDLSDCSKSPLAQQH